MASRPAQGNNSDKPFNRPRAAYVADAGSVVVSSGTLSRPKSVTGKFRGKTLVTGTAPKIVSL